MNHRLAGPLLAGLMLATALPLQAQERHTLSGERIAIYNLAGAVRVEPGEGRGVSVEVHRGGADAQRLRVETGRIDGRETLRVVYPGDEVVYREMGRGSRTSLRVAADGTFGRGAGSRQVRVQGSGRGTEAFADLVVRVPAGTQVALYQAVGRVSAERVDADLTLDTHSGAVTTSQTRGRLLIDTGSGGVRVDGAQGDVEIDTGSGGVQVRGVRARQLRIDTGSGGVTGEDLDVGRLHVDTGSGRVRLQQVGMVEGVVDTGSGAVELELTRAVRSLVIDTGSGGVRLGVPSDFGGQLEVDTGSGGISVDVPIEVTRRARSYLLGRIGAGEGSIRIDTGSGGVRVFGS